MATLKSQLVIIGSLGNLSFYKPANSEEVVVRQKGGPTKEMVLKSKRFVNTRLNMAEFGGRSKAAKCIVDSLRELTIVAKGRVSNALQRPLTAIQKGDTIGRKGERAIYLSRKPILLEGFSFDKKRTFESIISTPLGTEVFPDSATAGVTIPELIPGMNLNLPDRFPFYRIICSFAMIPDFHHSDRGYVPNLPRLARAAHTEKETEWIPARSRFHGGVLSMTLPNQEPDKPFVFLTSVAIQVGMPSEDGRMKPVKYQGAGKILRVVPWGVEE